MVLVAMAAVAEGSTIEGRVVEEGAARSAVAVSEEGLDLDVLEGP